MDSTRWIRIKELFMTAYDLPDESRTEFIERCDADLRPEVEKLLRAEIEADQFINEPAVIDVGLADEHPVDTYLGKHIDSYKIIKEIGHGGMGTVYLANRADKSFEKSVAVKLVKRGMDTNAVLKRFVMERQILAQLEHPNIASLLDGGSTTDGLPYFVMEYVEGLPITKFCDAHELSIDERLDLFIKVCTAISYAHQNLVVHRDIKPSNIIVTNDGTPKLLDFGIAKLLHPEWSLDTNEATATMFRVMTPEYASPEQIQGLPITTASDVYSLGVVLYELLCGERPFKLEGRMPEEAAQIVLTEEPVRPSSVVISHSSLVKNTSDNNGQMTKDEGQVTKFRNPQSAIRNLKGDLDNIILKALAKEPERRYQSVQEFSEDIRRHLEGLPVTATADTVSYRLAKFVKRYRTAAIAGCVIVLTLLAATAVTSWQAIVARRERDRADQRFSQVRKLAHTVLFDYHDGIAELAGSTPIREKMVKDALEYLDNLAGESAGDADLQRELAAAYQKVGDVQGNPYLANLGNPDGALESYRKGLAILEALPLTDANNAQTRFDLAKSHEKIGDILWAKGESAESQAEYRRALSIYEKLSSANDLSDPANIARLHDRIGQTEEQVGDFDGALASYQSALNKSQDLVATEPENPKYRRAVAVGYAKIGDIYYQKRDYKAASEHFQKSLPILQNLSANEPANTTLRRNLGLIYARVALAEMEAGNYSESIKYNLQAIDIQKQIVAADPNNLQIQFDLADVLANLGECFGRMGNLATATENFREAISISRQSLAKNPAYAHGVTNFANTYSTFAKILLKNGDVAKALENYRQALKLLDDEPFKSESTEKLAEIYEGMADASVSLNKSAGSLGEAKAMYQKSLDALLELQQKGKLNPDNTDKLNEIPLKIAKCETALPKAHRQ